jgi:adenosylmethionine-8-amino-7-oxononanoate aminotransferase
MIGRWLMGTIAAIDINNHEKAGYLNNVGRKIRHHALSRGVLLRPLSNVLDLMPPYCITETELVLGGVNPVTSLGLPANRLDPG